MKTTKSLKTVCLFFAAFVCVTFSFAQKINYQFVDSTTFFFKPVSEKCLGAQSIYIAPVVDGDSIFRYELTASLDMSRYTLVNSKNEADLILIYSTSFGNTTGNQSSLNPTPAKGKRYVPTSRETVWNHNFDSKKTAYQNSRSNKNSTSRTGTTSKSYTYKSVTPVVTTIELFDSKGNKIDESGVTEDWALEGHSSISIDVAKKDCELTLEKYKNQVTKDHLELAMKSLNDNYFFTKVKIPVFAITVKNKQFDDWNNAVSALNSWVNTPGRELDDPRIPIMEKIFEEQVTRDYGSCKDSALLASAAHHNMAIFQYYKPQFMKAGNYLTTAQSGLVYTDKSQRLFYENLITLIVRGFSF